MPALYRTSVGAMGAASPLEILGHLSAGLTREGFDVNRATAESWLDEVARLCRAFARLCSARPVAADWPILLEYVIPMIGERIDCVLLSPAAIFVIEFKAGASATAGGALRQAQSYSLNLTDFHEESRGRLVVPLALGQFRTSVEFDPAAPARGATVTEDGLSAVVLGVVDRDLSAGESAAVNFQSWERSRYFPVPTIIEAVSNIYRNNKIEEIAHSRAGIENLTATQDCIVSEVRRAKAHGKKILLILTGVPGAGKTLAGLNAVQAVQDVLDPSSEHASFMSGNGPLVAVLQEELRRSGRDRGVGTARSVKARVRDVHRFVRDSSEDAKPPSDLLIVFDEAQRAWTAERNFKKFGRNVSEPETILEIMSRHPRWAVVVALVGGGQEIHGGEAGLAAWGDAMSRFPDWEVVTSPEAIHGGDSVAGSRLFRATPPATVQISERAELHLSIPKRSIDSENTARWVNAVLSSKPADAAEIASRGLPITLTRSLATARSLLYREIEKGRRGGLIASSGAERLRADGVEPPTFTFLGGIDYKRWFLDPFGDHRSSNQLEVALSEFEMQGLEIDCAGLLWGGDLVWNGTALEPRRLKGDEWQTCGGTGDPQVAADDPSTRVLNKYRVLLTRFRKSMVIYVPLGSYRDRTARPAVFDGVYRYLRACGLSEAL